MKRWILFGLLGIAVLTLLGPGLVGLLAERTIERQLELAGSQDRDLDVSTVRFERGWFTSEGRHRLPVTNDALATLLTSITPGAHDVDGTPVLIVDTTIEHGPVPVGNLAGGNAARLLPAIATGRSTLELELDDGRRLPVPGSVESRVTLTGAVTVDYHLPSGAAAHAGVTARWDDSHLRASSSADGRELGAGFDVNGWQLDVEGLRVTVASASGSGSLRATPWGYALGDIEFELHDGQSTMADEAVSVHRVQLRSSSKRDDERVGAAFELDLENVEHPVGVYSARVAGAAGDFDGEAIGPLIRGLQRNVAKNGADAAYPGIDIDLRRALSAGGRLTLSEFHLDTSDGRIDATVDVAIDARDGLAEWAGLALAAEARAELSLSRSLANSPGFADSLRSLLAAGMLQPDGDRYVLDAELSNGIATINGAPLPLPIN